MVRKILFVFVGQALVYQVFTANLHPALQQYILAGLNQPTPSVSYPSVTIKKQTNPHNIQSLAALASLLSTPSVSQIPVKPSIPQTPTSLLAALSTDHSTSANPNLQSLAALAALLSPTPQQKPQSTPSPSTLLSALTSESPTASSNGIDASLLNNLAIALQLLLVSNIINTPQQDSSPEPLVVPGYPIHAFKESVAPMSVSYAHTNQPTQPVAATTMPKQNYNYEHSHPNYNHYESHLPSQIPNANFVGSSTFADSNPFGGTIPPASLSSSRGGFSLMSPYEALSPSSPYSDPILNSPFGSVMMSKKDFQSPYSSIMAAENKDLFSMADFF